MKYGILILIGCYFLSCQQFFAQVSVAERLGYPKNSKLLIIHADDLGVSHSENMASIAGLEKGMVNSASIMVPCPWFPEIAVYARKNKTADLGLHLTLNSEWDNYKWGPVTSRDSVSSLVNKNGYFYATVDSLLQTGMASEVELELTNQVKKALLNGIDVTHLDAHMGAAVSNPEFMAAYIRVGKKFQLPVLLDQRIFNMEDPQIESLIDQNTVVMDHIYSLSPEDYERSVEEYYRNLLKDLPEGISCLLIHLAYEDDEMKAVTIDHPYWAADWRQKDFDFFTSNACKQILDDEGIILVSWRALRDKISRAQN